MGRINHKQAYSLAGACTNVSKVLLFSGCVAPNWAITIISTAHTSQPTPMKWRGAKIAGSIEWRTVQHGGIGSNGPSGQSPVEGILADGSGKNKKATIACGLSVKSRILKPFARWTDDLPVTIRPKEAGRSGGPNYRPPSQTPSKSGGFSTWGGFGRSSFYIARRNTKILFTSRRKLQSDQLGNERIVHEKTRPGNQIGAKSHLNGSVIAPFPHQTGLP